MTQSPDAPHHVVMAHSGGRRGFWRTVYQGSDETAALDHYNDTAYHNPAAGGVRLLKEGKTIRYAGEMGKPGEDA